MTSEDKDGFIYLSHNAYLAVRYGLIIIAITLIVYLVYHEITKPQPKITYYDASYFVIGTRINDQGTNTGTIIKVTKIANGMEITVQWDNYMSLLESFSGTKIHVYDISKNQDMPIEAKLGDAALLHWEDLEQICGIKVKFQNGTVIQQGANLSIAGLDDTHRLNFTNDYPTVCSGQIIETINGMRVSVVN